MKNVSPVLAILFLTVGATAYAQPGSLDGTFGTGGKVTTAIGNNNASGHSVAIQSDGKIVVAGTTYNGVDIGGDADFALARYSMDGSLDNSFGVSGKVTTDFSTSYDYGYAVAIQSDGKIIMAGCTYPDGSSVVFALARYNTDGTLDNAFGVDGKVTTAFGTSNADQGNSVAIQPDGKIVVAGLSYNTDSHNVFAVARYRSNGTLDTDFGVAGLVTTNFGPNSSDQGFSVALPPDGQIIVAGNSYTVGGGAVFGLVRYNADGSLDNSFDGDGKVTTDFGETYTFVRSVTIQPDGKIIVAGIFGNSPNSTFAVVRYNTDGTTDNTFGASGIVTTDFGTGAAGYAVTGQPDGKIVVAGVSYTPAGSADFALARYNTDGTLDNSFGVDGKVTTDFGTINDLAYSAALQPDGMIVLAGIASVDFAVARYISGLNIGIIDLSIANTAPLIYPNPIKSHATLQYTLQNAETISIHLLDTQGKLVQTYIEGEHQAAGEHQQAIDLPEGLPAGNYLIAISSPKGRLTVQVTN